MEAILRLKHWQVFLIVVVPIAISIVHVVMLLTMGYSEIAGYDTIMQFVLYLAMFSRIAFIAWIYAVGVSLWRKLASAQVDIKFFKVCMSFVIIYLVITQLLRYSPDYVEVAFTINRVMYYVSWAAYLYTYYFIARMLVSVENGQLVSIKTSVPDFFTILFLFIGIWWIQPRINRIFSPDWENVNPGTPLDHNLDQQSLS